MDFLAVIKNIAPWVAGTFGTPLMGFAVKALVSGIPDENSAPILSAANSGDEPGALQKLGEAFTNGVLNIQQIKDAENKHVETMAQLGFKQITDLESIATDDRKNARDRDVAIVKATGHNYRGDVLAYGALVAFAAAGYALFYMNIPPANRDALMMFLGALTVLVKDIYGFEFSTTRDSQSKTGAIVDLAKSSNQTAQ